MNFFGAINSFNNYFQVSSQLKMFSVNIYFHGNIV